MPMEPQGLAVNAVANELRVHHGLESPELRGSTFEGRLDGNRLILSGLGPLTSVPDETAALANMLVQPDAVVVLHFPPRPKESP